MATGSRCQESRAKTSRVQVGGPKAGRRFTPNTIRNRSRYRIVPRLARRRAEGVGRSPCTRGPGLDFPRPSERPPGNSHDVLPGHPTQEGLVFLGDSRTNAGVDNVSTYRKVHLFQPAPDRIFVLESAGNLATTQEVLDRIHLDLDRSRLRGESLATVGHLFEAALYVGRLSREVAARHREAIGQGRGRRHGHLPARAVRSVAARPTSSWSTPRATTSGPPTTGRSSRSVRASTGSSRSNSAWPPTSI